MDITFYFKETKKGFSVSCDFVEMSIHKGTKAWGKTKESAMNNLCIKWNKKVANTYTNLLNKKGFDVSLVELRAA